MEIDEIGQKLEEANSKAHSAALKFADACATFEYMDEMKKTVLAQTINALKLDAYNRAEMSARAGSAYQTHLEATRDARKEMLTYKAHSTKWLNEFERLRSLLSAVKVRDRF